MNFAILLFLSSFASLNSTLLILLHHLNILMDSDKKKSTYQPCDDLVFMHIPIICLLFQCSILRLHISEMVFIQRRVWCNDSIPPGNCQLVPFLLDALIWSVGLSCQWPTSFLDLNFCSTYVEVVILCVCV